MENITKAPNGEATVAYLRTASANQIDSKLGILRQRQVCEEYARRLGQHLSTIYVDVGMSGLSDRRPALRQLTCDLSQGHIRHVVIADPTRLARSASLERHLSQLIRGHGATLTGPCDYLNSY